MNTSLSASKVSERQKAEAVRIVTDMARKAAITAVDKLAGSGMIEESVFQKNIIENASFAEGLATVFQPVIETEMVAQTRTWREKDGVIHLKVISDGTTGPQWISRLEGKGFRLSRWAKDVLNSKDFKPTTGVVYEVAILKGELFSDSDRITNKIRANAEERKLTKPNAEVACLIRENFSDQDIEAMGLWWIVAMHEPIKDSDGDLYLLDADRIGDGRWLDTAGGNSDFSWDREDGFAFVVSQVQSSVSST